MKTENLIFTAKVGETSVSIHVIDLTDFIQAGPDSNVMVSEDIDDGSGQYMVRKKELTDFEAWVG